MMKVSNKKTSVALSSVLAGLVLTVGKLIVGLLTGSMGILSEAAHSFLDLVAAVLTFFAVRLGDKPADDTHPFGHGKVESVSALVATGLLFLTSAWIIYEAIKRLFFRTVEVEATWYAFVVIIIAIVIDISRSRALKKVAQETKSQALEADALHFSSDIWSSLVVLLGLVLVAWGIKGADAVAALGVAIFVIFAGYRLGKRTIDVLVDTAPAGTTESVKAVVKEIPEVVGIERIRVRPLGPSMFVDMAVTVNRKLALTKLKETIAMIEDKVEAKLPNVDIVVHANPVQLNNETIIESIQILAAKEELSVHDIVVDNLDNHKYISYDLEVPEKVTIKAAHEQATKLEQAIQKELGNEVELSTHIEPLRQAAVLSANIAEADIGRITKVAKAVAATVQPLNNVHNIQIRKIEDKIFITLHCLVPGNLSLEQAHSASARLEYLIRDKLPEVRRVVVHAEPGEAG